MNLQENSDVNISAPKSYLECTNVDGASFSMKFSSINCLDAALRLAAQYHLGGLLVSDEELKLLVGRLKDLAIDELELGDGRKVESVRVERRVDGSVSIFFGI